MSVTDLEAVRKWKRIPKEIQQKLINNVFCRNCFTTTIVDYVIVNKEQGIVLQGKCKTCGGDVARMIEDE